MTRHWWNHISSPFLKPVGMVYEGSKAGLGVLKGCGLEVPGSDFPQGLSTACPALLWPKAPEETSHQSHDISRAVGLVKKQNDSRLSLKQGPSRLQYHHYTNKLSEHSFIDSYLHNALMLPLVQPRNKF